MAQPPVSPYSKSPKVKPAETSPKSSHTQQPNNPLHGVKLESIVTKLVEHYGWSGLHDRVRVNCFAKDPSVKSSLKFLRKTQWARDKVEALYIDTFC